jgi:hypothetical protein
MRADVTLGSLRHSWCGDCQADALFEQLGHDASAGGSHEWACTVCGAAYLDGINVVAERLVAKRGAA